MKNEIWKPIKGFEGHFEVSNTGKVNSLHNNMKRELIQQLNFKGYPCVSLRRVGYKRRSVAVHRLVLESFIENVDNKPTVNHKNGIKSDNRIDNLEWMTHKENVNHAWRIGLKEESRLKSVGKRHNNKGIGSGKGRTVLNIETGIYYNSIISAWLSTNMNRSIASFAWSLAYNKHKLLTYKIV